MIYCFKRLRRLRMTHIFILRYLVSAVVGIAAILFLFWIGDGMELYSAVVLCLMYGQPEYQMLRRMEMYEVRAELRDMNAPLSEKVEIAAESWRLMPALDRYAAVNFYLLLKVTVIFFWINGDILHMKSIESDLTIINANIFNYCSAAFLTLLALFAVVFLQFGANATMVEELKDYDD